MQRTYLWSSIALASVALVSVSCGSTTPFATPEIYIRDIHMLGAINAYAWDVSDEHVTLRFALESTEPSISRITPGVVTAGERLVIGDTFSASDIQFVDSVLYPSPDVPCADDTACASLGTGFTCQALDPSHSLSPAVCGQAIIVQVEVESLTYEVSSTPPDVVLAMYGGYSILGANPDPEGSPPIGLQWRSDPSNMAITGAYSFVERLHAVLGEDPRVCVGRWAGLGGLVSVPDASGCLIALTGDGRAAIRDELDAGGSTSETERALWGAVSEAVAILADDAEREGGQVIVFTDGPDTSDSTTYDAMVAAAVEAGVQLHVVHFDALAHDGFAPDLYPGALGGLDAQAQAACETGGSYQIATDPFDLLYLYRALALALSGHFSLDVAIPELQAPELPVGAYRVATTMTISLDGRDDTFGFRGATASGDLGQLVDRRLVVFRR